MLYNTDATTPAAIIRIQIRKIIVMIFGENSLLLCFEVPKRFLKIEAIHPQFTATWSPAKSAVKFKVILWSARHDLSLIVFSPRFGRTTCEIKKPETSSVITSMNRIALRKKLNRVRLFAILKNFTVET
jgi:hypothetical protein